MILEGLNFQFIALIKGSEVNCADLNDCVMDYFKLKAKGIIL